jgi:hypothetical protein
MIIKIKGGIGNQLYQYAFALRVRNKHGLIVKVNLDFFDSKMKYNREPLQISEKLNLSLHKDTLKSNTVSRIYKKLKNTRLHYFAYLLNERFGNIIDEKQQFGFRSVFQNRNLEGVMIEGYFTDYRYLASSIFELKTAIEKTTCGIKYDYDGHVALHIRRGDYEKIMRKQDKSIVLDFNYYKRCFTEIESDNNIIRVYTDDYNWAKTNLPLMFNNFSFDFSPEYISDVDSLWTMSNHKYIIGANSTFSLWAYYLNAKNIKCFTFPKEWAETIQLKGYKLFDETVSNVILVKED